MREAGSLINHPQLSEKVYEVIKEEILSARFPPNKQLYVVELADHLGVSRTPVKDALNRLSAEGFIADIPRKGYFVSGLNVHETLELLDARLVLELVAAERSIDRMEPADIAKMRRSFVEMGKLIGDCDSYVDYAGFIAEDYRFHLVMMNYIDNRHLLEMYRRLYLHLQAIRMRLAFEERYHRPAETMEGHRAMIEAFESRNLPALKTAVTDHVEKAKFRYLAVMQDN